MVTSKFRELIKDVLYREFIREAENNLISVSKHRVSFKDSANLWGGCFTALPKGVTYEDIEILIEKENSNEYR